MGTDHIFSKIKSRFNSFTQAEKKVAQFILDHTQEVIYMSITDLAIACEVGESSVFRFCKSLDLKGYQEFKIALAHSLSSENENTQLYNEVSVTDSVEELSSKLLTTTMTALKETYQLIQKEELMKAIQWMVNATSIHFFGVGSSLLTALEAQNK
ncbi:MurR/RpiR family transcriptional regulator [Caldibacillus thermoamylovorans]|uniref:MurR/RpiR family transcriptional regulator n=1 Tax=Caldibacillus thermoamylovorans TaxID=35841 RepID=UPI0020404ADF|nr:MurR/RpiR family transcriptional regulator [Caldibacillus thermoamylovorans]MCM3800289.1 MurR/RpiR family transcriptional regulator [Caldibacillus thermoamylovorans]